MKPKLAGDCDDSDSDITAGVGTLVVDLSKQIADNLVDVRHHYDCGCFGLITD